MLAYVQTRALVGGTTAIQGWPAFNRPPLMLLRNIDDEKAGAIVATSSTPRHERRNRSSLPAPLKT